MSDTNRTLNFLASAGPYANTTVISKEADEIMMKTGGQIMASGCLYDIVCKQLSPNVYRLTLRRFAA